MQSKYASARTVYGCIRILRINAYTRNATISLPAIWLLYLRKSGHIYYILQGVLLYLTGRATISCQLCYYYRACHYIFQGMLLYLTSCAISYQLCYYILQGVLLYLTGHAAISYQLCYYILQGVLLYRTGCVEQRFEVERDDPPLIVLSCSLYTHQEPVERGSRGVKYQPSVQLEHPSGVHRTLHKTPTTIMRKPIQ